MPFMTTEQRLTGSASSFTDAAIAAWKLNIQRATKIFDGLTDEQFFQQIAPNRNRILYILGHLTAVHDRMIPLLGLGERLHPELDPIFITAPDRTVDTLPSPGELKQYWTEINTILLNGFLSFSPEQWLERHTAVSEEDFAKDPTRNRFTVFLSRTNHAAFHIGQLVLVRNKEN